MHIVVVAEARRQAIALEEEEEARSIGMCSKVFPHWSILYMDIFAELLCVNFIFSRLVLSQCFALMAVKPIRDAQGV